MVRLWKRESLFSNSNDLNGRLVNGARVKNIPESEPETKAEIERVRARKRPSVSLDTIGWFYCID